jgi:hypothetical protein
MWKKMKTKLREFLERAQAVPAVIPFSFDPGAGRV